MDILDFEGEGAAFFGLDQVLVVLDVFGGFGDLLGAGVGEVIRFFGIEGELLPCCFLHV